MQWHWKLLLQKLLKNCCLWWCVPPQYALSNVHFFPSKTYPSLDGLVVNLHKHGVFATSRFSHYLPKYQQRWRHRFDYWHSRPITPIDWQLCLFFLSKVLEFMNCLLFSETATTFVILMSAPFFLVCYVCCLSHSCFVDAGKKIRFTSSI